MVALNKTPPSPTTCSPAHAEQYRAAAILTYQRLISETTLQLAFANQDPCAVCVANVKFLTMQLTSLALTIEALRGHGSAIDAVMVFANGVLKGLSAAAAANGGDS